MSGSNFDSAQGRAARSARRGFFKSARPRLKSLLLAGLCAAAAASAHADVLRYEAVWHSGSGTNIVTGPEPRASFIATGNAQTQAGRRLVDVETSIVDGQRIYTGIWVGGTGTNLFFGPMSAIEMRETIRERTEQGLRMVDFEVFRTRNGGRRYLSVWRPGTGDQMLTGPMQEDAFLARGQRLVEDEGMRLVDVEVERRQGVLLYHGLFRTGTGGNRITTPLRRQEFRARREEMRALGLELVDLERIRQNGQTRFVGVWASGDGEGQISLPRSFEDFVEFGQAHTADGFRTRDIELRVQRDNPDPNPPGEQEDPIDPDDDQSDPPPPQVLPAWLSIPSRGNPTVELRLGTQANTEEGYHITIHSSLLPDTLPLDTEFNPIIPLDFCGLRVFHPSSSFWENSDGVLVEDGTHLRIPSYADAELEPFALMGVAFEGPIGGCEDDGPPWEILFPLANTPNDPAGQSLRLIIEHPEVVEFLD